MTHFEFDSPVRAVRTAVRRQIPGKPLWAGAVGVIAAGTISIGLASAISAGIDDPAPYPNAKAAMPPVAALYAAAQAETAAAVEEPATASETLTVVGRYSIFTWGLSAAPAPAITPVTLEAAPEPVQTISPIVVESPAASAPVVVPVVEEVPAPVPEPVVEPAPVPAPRAADFYLPASVGGDFAMESRLLAGINAERARAGLSPYISDGSLVQIARTRSQQMVDQGYFGHTDANGKYMYTALLDYYSIGYAWAGENLAVNNYGAGESPERALVSLMNSATHRANILAGDFTTIGVGVAYHSDGRWFYSMIFTA